MLTLVTPSNFRDLIQLATVKTRLEISGSDDDTLLGELIDEASSEIETYLGTVLARQRYTETIGGRIRRFLYLQRWPLDDSDSLTLTSNSVAKTKDTDYAVAGREISQLWNETGDWSTSDEKLISVTYTAGYLMPGQVADWAAATAHAVDTWVRPTTLLNSPLRFKCTTAGTTHADTEPTWSSLSAGDTVTDGTVTWTAAHGFELPNVLRHCAWLAVQRGYDRRDSDLAARRAGAFSESFFSTSSATSSVLSSAVMRSLDAWRVS